MFIIRPVRIDDLDKLCKLVAKTGPGMTSLPADSQLLLDKIKNSIRSFDAKLDDPSDNDGWKLKSHGTYMFVLEEANQLKACSAIRSQIGSSQPFYSYEILWSHHKSQPLHIDKKIPYLQLKVETNGPTIISSLFVDPLERSKHYGKYMSLLRFLFIASFPEYFQDKIIAEIRGHIDSKNQSPFWEATVRHFMDMDFERADYLSAGDKGFIADLMPKHPIYIPLLSPAVRDAIGRPHIESQKAMAFLEAEGFQRDGHVDIFDAGPRIACSRSDIKSIRNSKNAKCSIGEPIGAHLCLISNHHKNHKDFRATIAKLKYNDIGEAIIDKETASSLKVKQGDDLSFIQIYD